jgi:DNA-binding transcriptional LysR family regulator
MDIKMLDYVVMIAQCGSISKAASKLYLTQSGLNQQLLKLEKQLGIKLFERDHHHFRITEAGKIYVRNAMEILRIQRNTLTQLSDIKNNMHAEISIGLTHEHGIDLFTAVYPTFHKRYPHLRCKLAEHIVADQYELIEAGDLDIGIVLTQADTYKKNKDLRFHEVYREDLLLGIPLNHPLAKKAVPIGTGRPLRAIDIRLFKDDPFSLIFEDSTMRREVIDPMFEANHMQPIIMLETAINTALSQIVSKGLSCTILPHSRVLASRYRDECAWFRLLSNPTWSVAVVYRKDYVVSHSISYLIGLMDEYGQEMEQKFLVESPGYFHK